MEKGQNNTRRSAAFTHPTNKHDGTRTGTRIGTRIDIENQSHQLAFATQWLAAA
ncbi:hypothetical protein GGI43DRAFT_412786 [Trichoderma evansii]